MYVKTNPVIGVLWIVLFLLSGVMPSVAQKYLLLEKRGNPKTERIQLYEQITFQLHDNNKIWYTRQILDMDVNGQMIQLGDTWLPLTDLSMIKLHRERAWVNILGTALQAGGISMILSDAWFSIQGKPEYSAGGWEWGLVNLAVGTGMKAVFAPIIYKLGGKHRLRLVDLTF
jgi:hypothetical protein